MIIHPHVVLAVGEEFVHEAGRRVLAGPQTRGDELAAVHGLKYLQVLYYAIGYHNTLCYVISHYIV